MHAHAHTHAPLLILKRVCSYLFDLFRFPMGSIKPSAGKLKETPKTEDFITYLCLRGNIIPCQLLNLSLHVATIAGSSHIPTRFNRFETPWTRTKKPRRVRRQGA